MNAGQARVTRVDENDDPSPNGHFIKIEIEDGQFIVLTESEWTDVKIRVEEGV